MPTLDAGLAQWNGSAWISGVSYALFQSGVDAIFPPSGTMGNNCAFTLGTALDAIYPSAYIYFRPGAIFTGSQPGWYYTVMSSTTVGTCYNLRYSFGQPIIPVSLAGLSFVTTGPGAWTSITNTAITGFSANVPAFGMGLNGRLDVRLNWTASNTAGSKGIAMEYAGTAIGGTDYETTTNTTNLITTRTIINRGATNAQVGQGVNGSGALTAQGYYAIDSTLGQSIWLYFNNLTAATDWSVLHSMTAELRPAGALDVPSATQPTPAGPAIVPPGAAAFGYNHNAWFATPTAADVSLTANTTSKLFAGVTQSQAHFTTVNGMLSLNQLGDGVNTGVSTIDNNNVRGALSTLPSATGWYIEAAMRITANDPDHWQAAYANPIEKFVSGATPYVEVDGDEQIGAQSANNLFYGSTNSALNWPTGSNGSSVTYNNLSPPTFGPNIDRTKEHIYGWGYDPIGKQCFFFLDGIKQPFTVATGTLGFDANIATGHYFLVLNASSHGTNVPYSLIVRYISAWTP